MMSQHVLKHVQPEGCIQWDEVGSGSVEKEDRGEPNTPVVED